VLQNKAGSPFDEDTFLGPQISAGQHVKIMKMIGTAKTEGARLVVGGGSPSGWFIEPTIFADVKPSMQLMREEVFGPVVAVAPFRTSEDALQMANDTCYGLASGVFTSDMKTGMRMARGLEAGSVWVNCYNSISHQLPFGGYKESGNGKDLGGEAMNEFTHTKTVRFML
jgi:acyl-CoA reductase-like NAD-dependent aldehyde dehydrogenase